MSATSGWMYHDMHCASRAFGAQRGPCNCGVSGPMTAEPVPPSATPHADVMARTIAVLDDYAADLLRLEHCAQVLRTFYCASFTMGAVRPVLDLALELNPDLQTD